MVTARRKHQTFTWDASKWKAMLDRPDNLKARERPKGEREEDRAQDSDDDLDNLMAKPRGEVQTVYKQFMTKLFPTPPRNINGYLVSSYKVWLLHAI